MKQLITYKIIRYSFICAVTCLAIALIRIVPESPLYYLTKNNEIKTKNSLKWYRGQTYDDIEMEELKYLATLSHSKKVKYLFFIVSIVNILIKNNKKILFKNYIYNYIHTDIKLYYYYYTKKIVIKCMLHNFLKRCVY